MLRPAACACVFFALTSASLAVELVPPDVLTATFFDSKPVTTTDARGRASRLVFSPAGTLTRTNSAGRASEGVWRLSEDGFCMQVGGAKRESCYIVLKKEDGSYSALKRPSRGFTWSR